MTGKEKVCYNIYTPKWFKPVLNWAIKTAPKPCSLVLFLSDLEPQGGKKNRFRICCLGARMVHRGGYSESPTTLSRHLSFSFGAVLWCSVS